MESNVCTCGRRHPDVNCPECGRVARRFVLNPSEPPFALPTYSAVNVTVNGVPFREVENKT